MTRPLNVVEDLIPAAEAKQNFSRMLEQVSRTQRPVVITKNGRAKVVVLAAQAYEDLTYRARFTEAVDAGLEAAKHEPRLTQAEAFERIRARRKV